MYREKIRSMCFVSLGSVFVTLCAWLTLPATVPFTAQTFAVALILSVLGGKRGTVSLVLYLSMGALGLPVFSGFLGGAGILLGKTGGYLLGFFVWGVAYWLVTLRSQKAWSSLAGNMIGQILCYISGTVWYVSFYLTSVSTSGIVAVMAECVFPFLAADALKIILAHFVAKKLKNQIKF